MLKRLWRWLAGSEDTVPVEEPANELPEAVRELIGTVGRRMFEICAPGGGLDVVEFCWVCAIVAGRSVGRVDRTLGGKWLDTMARAFEIELHEAAEIRQASAATLPDRKLALEKKVRSLAASTFPHIDPLLAAARQGADALAFVAATEAFTYGASKFASDPDFEPNKLTVFATMLDLSSVAAVVLSARVETLKN